MRESPRSPLFNIFNSFESEADTNGPSPSQYALAILSYQVSASTARINFQSEADTNSLSHHTLAIPSCQIFAMSVDDSAVIDPAANSSSFNVSININSSPVKVPSANESSVNSSSVNISIHNYAAYAAYAADQWEGSARTLGSRLISASVGMHAECINVDKRTGKTHVSPSPWCKCYLAFLY